MISNKLISHFDMNVFPRVVWTLLQLTAFVLKLQQKNVRGKKAIVWKTALIPQYFLSRMWSIIFSCMSDCIFHWNGTPMCVFTNIMNNSAQFKDRELRILVLFLSIIPEMRSLLTLECAACVCVFRKLWVLETSAKNL